MDNSNEKYVLCELPKAGLGNMLFPLLKAFIFAHLNSLPIIITGYHQIKFGPYLRRDKSKRRYGDYFTFQKNIFGEFIDRIRLKSLRNYDTIEEPSLKQADSIEGKIFYRFGAIPYWGDYFKDLKEHRKLAISILWSLVRPEIKERVQNLPSPIIGVHIRMGDFRKLQPGEDFSKVGTVRTPEEYFLDVIKSIRETYGKDLPVSIFTNGYKDEFRKLSALGNITFIEGNKDIEDMLLLSKSKIIVASANSTFGYWAGFLSEAPIILHPDHIHQPIRGFNSNELYEGPFDFNNEALVKILESIMGTHRVFGTL